MDPEYQYYSLEELREAQGSIDGKSFPDRLQRIEQEIQRREDGIKESARPKLCPSCLKPLIESKVKLLVGRSLFMFGVFSEAAFWGLLVVFAFLLSMVHWPIGIVAAVLVGLVLVLLGRQSIAGYVCKSCNTQFAPWQIKN